MERRNCPVCLELCLSDSIKLPCGHQYHKICLDKQLENAHLQKCAECLTVYRFNADHTKIELDRQNYKICTKINKWCTLFSNYFLKPICFAFYAIIALLLIISPFYSIVWISLNKRDPLHFKNVDGYVASVFFVVFIMELTVLSVKLLTDLCIYVEIKYRKRKYRKRKYSTITIEQLPSFNPIATETNSSEINIV